jgi:PIN domain nuclease of toxin-antitoxin system
MRLLLDTHIAIWAIRSPERIGANAQQLIANQSNDIVVSAVTIWEIAIKRRLGDRPGRPPFSSADAIRHFSDAGFEILSVSAAHAMAVEHLPLIHGDPFDRLLVAQALSEPLRLVSSDERILAYGAGFIDART